MRRRSCTRHFLKHLLQPYVLEKLSEEQALAVEDHLRQCEACREEFEMLISLLLVFQKKDSTVEL